jgi:electron transport complex protein RnfC
MPEWAKGSSGLVLMNEKAGQAERRGQFLRCARCVDVSPMNLLPSKIAAAVK